MAYTYSIALNSDENWYLRTLSKKKQFLSVAIWLYGGTHISVELFLYFKWL